MNFGIKASTVRQFLISSGLPSKKAIQIVNQTLNELKVEKHPDKTFIGRIAKGFDLLGYSFEPKGLSIAPKTLANFLERITQLYEQGADVKRIGQYVRNWLRWVNTGVEICVVNKVRLWRGLSHRAYYARLCPIYFRSRR